MFVEFFSIDANLFDPVRCSTQSFDNLDARAVVGRFWNIHVHSCQDQESTQVKSFGIFDFLHFCNLVMTLALKLPYGTNLEPSASKHVVFGRILLGLCNPKMPVSQRA